MAAAIRDIMLKAVVTVNKGDSLKKVSDILVSKKLSGVPVVDSSGSLVGFISERDIIAAVGADDFMKKRVSDVMTKKVISVEENAPIEQVSRLFTDGPFRYIPVTKSARVVGIVSRKDVINRLLGQYY